MANINFNNLLQQVVNLFHTSNRGPKASNKDLPFTGFQAPIKGSYFNSGNFSPGQSTDFRHPKGHAGTDLRSPGGTAVYPIAPGIVTYVGTDSKGGNIVNITHPQGVRAYYAHLGTASVHKGDKVGYETVIGTVGNSGNAAHTWPHLHIQVWKDNQLQNPGSFFSVPPYTTPDVKTEKPWLSQDAKIQATNFNMEAYKQQNQRAASRVDDLLTLSSYYEESIKK